MITLLVGAGCLLVGLYFGHSIGSTRERVRCYWVVRRGHQRTRGLGLITIPNESPPAKPPG